jgi:hypothetical protein
MPAATVRPALITPISLGLNIQTKNSQVFKAREI